MTEQTVLADKPAPDFLQTPSAPEVLASAGEGSAPSNTSGNQPGPQAAPLQDPLSYENLTLPENCSAAPETLDAFKALAREINLTEEQAQKLVDYEASLALCEGEAAEEEKRQTLERWAGQSKALYGAKLEEELSYALRAADAFGGPDLRTLLEDTGLGNHPVIIRTLGGVGRAMSEDVFPGGKPSAPQDKTFAEALYGKNN